MTRTDLNAVAVFCAAHNGNRPSFVAAASAIGEELARRQLDLVYGGGHLGLMGVVADAAQANGGKVVGVITEHLYRQEVAFVEADILVVVEDMPSRKREMFNRADAFIVLPGGIGTLEELSEVWCWSTLGLHRKPIVLVNLDGYYDSLLAFLAKGMDVGLVRNNTLDYLIVVDNPLDAVQAIAAGK